MSKNKDTGPQVSGAVINKADFFEKLGNKGVFLALGFIALVAFFIFKDFILLKKLYLYKDIGSDTLNGVFPFFYNYAHYVERYGIPSWSFQEALGQNVLGGFLRDPFMIIGYLAGSASMPKIYVFEELTKIISGGVVFYLFLKQLKVTNFSALVGCLLFTFSGFMIVGSCWYVFTFEAFTIALALLGFELFFQKNKWLVFILAIFLIAISMPVNIYITGVILLFYIIFRLGQTEQLTIKNLLQIIFKLIGLGLIGLLLSAPFFFETILLLLQSPRGSGETGYFKILSSKPMFALIDKMQFGTFITRLFSNDFIGTGNNFRGFQNFLEAPLSYCGILSIVLMPQIFTQVSKSTRKWYIIWLSIWVIATIFPYFRYAFWLFSGDYFRVFSFCLSLVFIVYSVLALDIILKTKKLNLITLGITILVSIILLTYNYFKGTQVKVDSTVSMFVYFSIFVYALLLFLMTRPDPNKNIKYALLGFVCIEMAFLSGFSINRRDIVSANEWKEKVGYNDYSVEAVDYIKKKETGFYRIDKNYYSSGAMHGSLSDNKIHDYFSTSAYSSFSSNKYVNFLRLYGVIGTENEYETRWAPGLINRPILESLTNVKYIMVKGYTNPVWHNTHDSVAKFGDVLVLKNKFSLPFGYTYDQYIKQSEFEKLSLNQRDFVSLKAIVIDDKNAEGLAGLKKYNVADTALNAQFTFDTYKADVQKLSQNSLKLTGFNDLKIQGDINVDSAKLMYLSFPIDKGWHLTLDGKEKDLVEVNNGMTGIYLDKGNHKIEMNFKLRMFNKGLMLIPVGLLLMLGLYFLDKKNKNFLKIKLTN